MMVKTTRRIQWASLGAASLFLLGCMLRIGAGPELYLPAILIALLVSVICGIVLIRHHRLEETFLPAVDYVIYGIAVLAFSWFAMAILYDHFKLGQYAYFVAVGLPWVMFVGPWLVLRRRQSPPMVVDAALVIAAVVYGCVNVSSLRWLPSLEELATYGLLVFPVPIALTAWVLWRVKKSGKSEFLVALGIGGFLVLLAWLLLPGVVS